ncbi:LysR family transcriptional regulator [Pelomonas sp. Root1444]|uniref:LysR family transcriptional regulator n=1 Tax=Pelomonas sp. Root1444 TaxID=1736464 RepID=UPI000702DC84|nr:LysR family transcriptional regulator [Pelomonas sp. Root1444]KQY82426.1 LysR family transcriptional regulator [Pelomonas sp. Root1444]
MASLGDIELFVEVARAKGFRRAADLLDMPNSTLSRRITELERQVGVRLFHRTTRKVELTEAGSAYFRRCEGLVAEARVAHEALLDVAERPSGVLRVSMPVDLAITYLAAPLRVFAERYPLIDFELDLTARRVDLVADGFDLAIRLGEPPATPSSLIARRLGAVKRQLYASPHYLKAAPPLEQPRDLARHSCIMLVSARQAGWTLHGQGQQLTVPVSGRYAMNSLGMCRAFARLGLGIAVMGPEDTEAERHAGELVRVLPDWALAPLAVHAITESRLLPSRVRLFVDFLAETLQER